MPLIGCYQDWAIKEGLLALSTADPMQIPVFRRVAGIPIKTRTARKFVGGFCHIEVYITPIYAPSRQSSRNLDV
jgi:hypothetical protein